MSTAQLASDGTLRFGRETLRVAWGRGGLVAHKREGDGGTPIARLPLRRVLYRADRVARPLASVPVEPLAPQDGWCDDPADARYNRMLRLPADCRHEALWRADGLYDIIGVLGWNDAPVVRGAGSAIFLHVATREYAPTEGCLALALPDLVRMLANGLTDVSTEE